MNFKDQHWLIIGGGVSGRSAAKYLRASGANVSVSDSKPLKAAQQKDLESFGVKIVIGEQTAKLVDGCNGVIVSPGVPATAPVLVAAKQKQLPILTEIDLALSNFKGKVIGITGTNGKSTTTVMIEHLLKQAGVNAIAGGNLGIPASELTSPKTKAPDVLVLELSSYQLEQTKLFRASAGVFTSFSHDHMGRHGSLENYFLAKWRMFAGMTSDDVAIMTPQIAELAQSMHAPRLKAKTVVISEPPSDIADLLNRANILEVHNQLNAAFAIAVVQHLTKKTAKDIAPLMKGFRGLPFRFEHVGDHHGQPVYNDSKSTNVESILVALKSTRSPCLLLVGGQSKDEPFQPIVEQYGNRIAKVLIFGASGPEIHNHLQSRVPCVLYPTLKDLLAKIGDELKAWNGPVVFSPGCASFDEFDNFEHRGRFFTEKIQSYLD